ncbi:MAG: hypothetical protein FWG14_10210 [Peptococcaceae bacterium]|nr:hypothetical protein [Peptococcaceae bacterium]
MPKLTNTIILSPEEIAQLNALTHKGASARAIMHANILLFTNDGLGNKKKGICATWKRKQEKKKSQRKRI